MNNRPMHESFWVDVIKPQLVDNAAVTSSWLSMTDAVRLFAVINMGATDITVDAKIEQATDSSGTGAKDVTGAAITQFLATDDNKYASIDLEAARMDIANGFNYARLKITVADGTTGAYVSASIFRPTRHAPPTQVAAYAQQIVVAG